MRVRRVIGVGLCAAFAALPARASLARWLGSASETSESQLVACRGSSPRTRPAPASVLPAGLVEENAQPSVVFLIPAPDAPAPRVDTDDRVDASMQPLLTLASPVRVPAGAALGLSAAWRGPPQGEVTVAHPFFSGGKTQVVYTLFVRDESDRRIYQLIDETPMMCGTRNALGEKDFIPLRAGESTEVTPRTDTGADLTRTHLDARGRYTVWLSYAFCGTGPSFFLTPDRKLPPHTYSGETVSNAVAVEVY